MHHLGQSKPLFDRFGYSLEAAPGSSFSDLNPRLVERLFEAYGLVHFRGFAIEPCNVMDCVRAYSDVLLRMDAPNRRDALGSEGATVLTDFQGKAIPLHAENSYFFEGFWPEIIWFYCETPASEAGETTVCDGVSVWAEFDSELKRVFLEQRLIYKLCVPAELLHHGVNADDGPGNLRAAIARLSAGEPGARYWNDEAGNFFAEVKRHAVVLARNGTDYAFVNHICSFQEPALVDDIRFEGGQPLSPRLMTRIRSITDGQTRKISWRAGDLVMIDNRRVMHGRTAYDREGGRRMISAMTLQANFGFGQSFRTPRSCT